MGPDEEKIHYTEAPHLKFHERHIGAYLLEVLHNYREEVKQKILDAKEGPSLAEQWIEDIVEKRFSNPHDIRKDVQKKIQNVLSGPDSTSSSFRIKTGPEVRKSKSLREIIDTDPNFENPEHLFDAPFSLGTDDIERLLIAEERLRPEWKEHAQLYSPSFLIYLAYCYHELQADGLDPGILKQYKEMALSWDRAAQHEKWHDPNFCKRESSYETYAHNRVKMAVLRKNILQSPAKNTVRRIEVELQPLFEHLSPLYFDKQGLQMWLLNNASNLDQMAYACGISSTDKPKTYSSGLLDTPQSDPRSSEIFRPGLTALTWKDRFDTWRSTEVLKPAHEMNMGPLFTGISQAEVDSVLSEIVPEPHF